MPVRAPGSIAEIVVGPAAGDMAADGLRVMLDGLAPPRGGTALFRQRLVDQRIDERPEAPSLLPGTWAMKTTARSSTGSAHHSVP
jgi:hypothetical protein